MATSVGEAAVRGIQTGFNIVQDYNAGEERKRATGVQEARQRDMDARAQEQSDRENRRLADQEQRQGLQEFRQSKQDEAAQLHTQFQAADALYKTHTEEAANARIAGRPLPPEWHQRAAQAYQAREGVLQQIMQPAIDRMSRLKAGQVSVDDMSPAEFAQGIMASTRSTPQQIEQYSQGVADVHAGLESNNQSLILKGANAILSRELNQGVGAFTPSGHRIVRKELIGLDPARGGDGREHPDMVIPRMRVYVDTNQDGVQDQYYDAPLTLNRSADPNDPVKAVPLEKLFESLGNVGTLATALSNPLVQKKFQEGVAGSKDWIAQVFEDHGAAKQKRFSVDERLALFERIDADPTLTPEQKAERKRVLLNQKAPTELDAAKAEEAKARAAAIPVAAKAKADTAKAALIRANKTGTGAGSKTASPDGATRSGIDDSNKDLRGEALLATLDPQLAADVRSVLGGNDPKSFSARSNYRGKVEGLAQLAGEGYTSKKYPTAAATEKAFATGIEGRKLRAFNVAIDHMETVKELGSALENGNVTKFNELANFIATQTGKPAPTNFAAARDIVADEVIAGVVGSTGALADREKAAETIRSAASPKQLSGVLSTFQKLLGGQLVGLGQQYRAGGGEKDFATTFLTPRALKTLQEVPAFADFQKTQAGRSTGVAAAQNAPTATPAAAAKEGAKQTSKSGKPMVFTNGKWVYE